MRTQLPHFCINVFGRPLCLADLTQDAQAKAMSIDKPYVRVIEGKLISYVEVHLPFVKHVVTLKSSPGTNGFVLKICVFNCG